MAILCLDCGILPENKHATILMWTTVYGDGTNQEEGSSIHQPRVADECDEIHDWKEDWIQGQLYTVAPHFSSPLIISDQY